MKEARIFDEEFSPERVSDYQSVFFGSDAGYRVLTDLLVGLGYYNLAETDEDRILNNFAKKVIGRLGKLEASNVENLTRMLAGVEDANRVYVQEPGDEKE